MRGRPLKRYIVSFTGVTKDLRTIKFTINTGGTMRVVNFSDINLDNIMEEYGLEKVLIDNIMRVV